MVRTRELSCFETHNSQTYKKIIGEVNNTYIKIVKIKGDKIPWHAHENEMFYILEGSLFFEIENAEDFIMNQGDFFIVKKGIKHRVSSTEECKIMLIEHKTTAHTGDVISEITRTIGEQQG